MNIQTQVQLKPFNTLNLNAVASHYVKIQSVDALLDALDYAEQQQLNVLILSGGSNMLLPEQLHALVLHMDIQGTEHIAEDELTQTVRVGAGQPWHDFVLWTTAQGLFGLQNLALIPGLVGASPVQNIGAYGVEAGEFIDAVHVYDRYEKAFARIAAADWLARLGSEEAVAPLRAALAKEKRETAMAAMLGSLSRLGQDLADDLRKDKLAAEAAKGISKTWRLRGALDIMPSHLLFSSAL